MVIGSLGGQVVHFGWSINFQEKHTDEGILYYSILYYSLLKLVTCQNALACLMKQMLLVVFTDI